VRTLLDTYVPGIGFNVVYKRQEDGVWFPSTFGTEFRLHAVFFINRDISVSCENSGFQRTHVESKMKVIWTGGVKAAIVCSGLNLCANCPLVPARRQGGVADAVYAASSRHRIAPRGAGDACRPGLQA
jgi:hypothetical protein